MEEFICKKLSDWFECPCNFTFDGKDASDTIDPTGTWCEVHSTHRLACGIDR